MRTRSRYLSPPPFESGLPSPPSTIHNSTKRNAASSLDDSSVGHQLEDISRTTPNRPAKRVRFSDAESMLSPPSSQSSGLTPELRRAKLSAKARRRWQGEYRTILPSPSSAESESYCSQPIHFNFTPIKEVLDPRIRRRLRRSHLSEEINYIEEQDREDARNRRELAHLQSLEVEKEEKIKELELQLELQRQFGIHVNVEQEDQTRNIQHELQELKRQLQERQASINSPCPNDEMIGQDETDAIESDAMDTFWSDGIIPSSPSPLERQPKWMPDSSKDASAQVALPDLEYEAKLLAVEETVASLRRELNDSKSARELIRDELNSLGFAQPGSNLEDILATIRDLFKKTRLDLERLLPGETVGGFQNGALLLSTMNNHIKNLLEKLKESGNTIKTQQQSEAALRGHFNQTLSKAEALEAAKVHLAAELERRSVENHADKERHRLQVEELQSHISNSDKDIDTSNKHILELEADKAKLQDALHSYRSEVTKLEDIIERLDQEKSTAVSELTQSRDCARTMEVDLKDCITQLLQEKQELSYKIEAGSTNIEVAHQEIAKLKTQVTESKKAIGELEIALANVAVFLRAHGQYTNEAFQDRVHEIHQRLGRCDSPPCDDSNQVRPNLAEGPPTKHGIIDRVVDLLSRNDAPFASSEKA